MLDSPTVAPPTIAVLQQQQQLERIESFRVVYAAKDSVHVRWQLTGGEGQRQTSGYNVHYQAVGSTVRLVSSIGQPDVADCTITNLHENTYYDICVQQQLANASLPTPAVHCVRAVTATDSMAVAVGTGFGAFLTLSLIAFLIFVAKWQHKRTARKQRHLLAYGEGSPAAGGDLLHSNGGGPLLLSNHDVGDGDFVVIAAPTSVRKQSLSQTSASVLVRTRSEGGQRTRRSSSAAGGRRKSTVPSSTSSHRASQKRRRESASTGTASGGGGRRTYSYIESSGGGRRLTQISTTSGSEQDGGGESSVVVSASSRYTRQDTSSGGAPLDLTVLDVDDFPSTSMGIRHYDHTPKW